MLFLLGVAIASIRLGRGPSLLAAVATIAAYDFFFVPPALTLRVSDARYALTFAMMLVSSLGLSSLMSRLRRQEERALHAAMVAKTEELRSALLSTVSHDLRTPLAAMTGAATALRDDPDLTGAMRRDLVEEVCEEAERMERLISNVLEMTRLESGAAAARREWVPLVDIAGAALSRVERRLGGHEVRTSFAENLPLALVDPVLLEHLLVNLLENASKHTPPGTVVELRAAREAQTFTLEVADWGAGIPSGEEDVIFERFRRGSKATASGVGMGLAIARAIAQVHGGRLDVRQRPGGGAVFRLTLPITGPPPEVPGEPEGEQW
jgi:two-component system, OmpR family, sensor histidine kinase KdpD